MGIELITAIGLSLLVGVGIGMWYMKRTAKELNEAITDRVINIITNDKRYPSDEDKWDKISEMCRMTDAIGAGSMYVVADLLIHPENKRDYD